MWPRIIEIVLACWLMASPFIFRLSADETSLAGWFLAGLGVMVLSFFSYWDRTHRAYLLNLVIAGGLIVSGYVAGHPASPSAQNQIVVGLLLAMFAIIPNGADEIPRAWKVFYEKRGRTG
jgi:4-amino-4-deoxy-L-arabinose transferase-like glycosyltransferase